MSEALHIDQSTGFNFQNITDKLLDVEAAGVLIAAELEGRPVGAEYFMPLDPVVGNLACKQPYVTSIDNSVVSD